MTMLVDDGRLFTMARNSGDPLAERGGHVRLRVRRDGRSSRLIAEEVVQGRAWTNPAETRQDKNFAEPTFRSAGAGALPVMRKMRHTARPKAVASHVTADDDLPALPMKALRAQLFETPMQPEPTEPAHMSFGQRMKVWWGGLFGRQP
ncbi:MAG: hypothetical protein U1E46_01055 [Hyphomicrobiales bacterium]